MDVTNVALFEPATHHNIPGVFWTFLNRQRPGAARTAARYSQPLTDPWNFATGYPISEAYWARVKIAGAAAVVC